MYYSIPHKIKILFIAEISSLFGFTLTSSIKEKSFCWKTINFFLFVCLSDQNGWNVFVSLVLCQFEKFWAQKGVQLTKKGSLSPLWRHGVQYETIELLRDSMSARTWRTQMFFPLDRPKTIKYYWITTKVAACSNLHNMKKCQSV